MNLEKEWNELKMDITPVKALKFVAGTVVSLGATAAVVAALKNPLQAAKGLTKLMMKLGIFVLGCKAGDMAEQYFNNTVDEAITAFSEAKEGDKLEHTADGK